MRETRRWGSPGTRGDVIELRFRGPRSVVAAVGIVGGPAFDRDRPAALHPRLSDRMRRSASYQPTSRRSVSI